MSCLDFAAGIQLAIHLVLHERIIAGEFPALIVNGDRASDDLSRVNLSPGAGNSGQFVGPSGGGFAIEGWYQNGRINAAYPLRDP